MPGMKGFTLIELLVVLALVSLMTGLAVVSLPAFLGTADFDEEADRLLLLLKTARREAVLDSLDYGFRAERGGYEFLLFDDAEQQWLRPPPPLHGRSLPADIHLTLDADGRATWLAGEGVPPVLILSSGEVTPFILTLTSAGDDLARTLKSDGYAELAWDEQE